MNEREMQTHAGHCCREHGCKYCDDGCPVVLGRVEQLYDCEECSIDKNILTVHFSDQIPKEEGVYLFRFNKTKELNLLSVYMRPAEQFGGKMFSAYLAIREWGWKSVDRGYDGKWSQKLRC